MNYTQRHLELNARFQPGVDMLLESSNTMIRFLLFRSLRNKSQSDNWCITPTDLRIKENLAFFYPVFMPTGMKKVDKAIVLLHGLNERNWNKYLVWAEYLCQQTGKAVILFPLAFHINRSPQSWSNPRDLRDLLDLRRQRNGEDRSLSFANAALSMRITENPYRFYSSGRQSVDDLSQLFAEIKQGNHPLFVKNTNIDIFAYSIGAFLAEITLMTNPQGLFSSSKLFLLCGGSIFSAMRGQSRGIMDRMAFDRLYSYYMHDFVNDASNILHDKLYDSFNTMISPERNRIEREHFFDAMGDRIKGISLTRDTVIPYHGVVEALGAYCANNQIQLIDFPFEYTHENPFPVAKLSYKDAVDQSFDAVFSDAVEFLT